MTPGAGFFRTRWRDRDNCCVGITMSGLRCANVGRKRQDGQYWCNQHVVQQVTNLIQEDARDR